MDKLEHVNIVEIEIAINKAIDVMRNENLSCYELRDNLKKLKINIKDLDAYNYLVSLCTSSKGLQDIYLESVEHEEWLDIIDNIHDALSN